MSFRRGAFEGMMRELVGADEADECALEQAIMMEEVSMREAAGC